MQELKLPSKVSVKATKFLQAVQWHSESQWVNGSCFQPLKNFDWLCRCPFQAYGFDEIKDASPRCVRGIQGGISLVTLHRNLWSNLENLDISRCWRTVVRDVASDSSKETGKPFAVPAPVSTPQRTAQKWLRQSLPISDLPKVKGFLHSFMPSFLHSFFLRISTKFKTDAQLAGTHLGRPCSLKGDWGNVLWNLEIEIICKVFCKFAHLKLSHGG